MYFKLIEGESVFSLVARHHAVSPYNSLREKNRTILNRTNVKLNPRLPCSINAISSTTGIPSEQLITLGTIYPIVSATLSNTGSKNELREAMLSDQGTSVAALARINSSRLKIGNTIKYCPCCLSEDEHLYGYGIWYSHHQLAGVAVCPKHLCWLVNVSLDADGLNKRIEPPPSEFNGTVPSLEPPPLATVKLSRFLVALYSLTQNNSVLALSDAHIIWLDAGGYLTSGKHIRLDKLSKDFNHYWKALFKQGVLPNELSEISYVRNIIKPDKNVHYVKHALLGAFFADSPTAYYSKSTEPNDPPISIPELALSTDDTEKAMMLLRKGLSLRSVAIATGHSVGFILKLASQHDIPIKHRYKRLNDEMISTIIKMAYRGIHRKSIAKECGVGIACVEQKIEGQEGLSDWRRKLRYLESRNRHRKSLMDYRKEHPDCSRNEIRKRTSDYNWLFRHDKTWLLQHLPKKVIRRFYALTHWDDRDTALVERIQSEIVSATSLSDIDRQLVGSPSIIKNKTRLPLAYSVALRLLDKNTTSKS